MLLDAMTEKPEWCGALAEVNLHRLLREGGQETGGLKHKNKSVA